jgi:hypothetical protein
MNVTSKEKIILLVFVCLYVVQSKSQTKSSVPPLDESPVGQIFISSDGCFLFIFLTDHPRQKLKPMIRQKVEYQDTNTVGTLLMEYTILGTRNFPMS